jgi:hypothetical protein
MNHRCAVIAVPALALGAFALTTAEASARVPAEDARHSATVPHDPPVPEYKYPEYKLGEPPMPATIRVAVPVDDNVAEALQASATALGGAGLALGGVWLYRRRHPLAS